jgi:hypothetical protein
VYKSLTVGNAVGGGYQQFWVDLLHQAREQGFATFLPAFIAGQFAAIWHGFVENLDLRSLPSTHVIAAIIVLIAIPTWIARLRQNRLDAWYLLIGGGMTLVYPFPTFSTRLVMPWIPVLLFYMWLGISKLATSMRSEKAAAGLRWGAVVMLMIAWLPSLVFIASRFATPIDPALAQWKHTRYWFRRDDIEVIKRDVAFRQSLVVVTRAIADDVPEGECVMTVHTAIAMLYGRRVAQQPPPPSAVNFAERLGACRYLLLVSSPAVVYGERVNAYYPAERLSPGMAEPLIQWGDPIDPDHPTAILLRLKPAT